jgi:hypothetical protein
MPRWLNDLLWGSSPVEFESSFGLHESVERLKTATRRSIFSALARQEAVGTVKESRVSLQRVIPMVGNAFKPFFRGRFIEINGKVMLVGRSTMHPLIKMFTTFWFGAASVGAILAVTQARQVTLATLFAGAGMIAAATALVGFGRWFARNDTAWLSEVIRGALRATAANQSTCADRATPRISPSGSSSTALGVVAIALVLIAAICWFGAIFGIQSMYISAHGSVTKHFPNIFSRYIAAGFGTILPILSYGVYRRRLIAWRAGFALLAGSWLSFIGNLLSPQSPQINLSVAIIFSILSLAVAFVWIRWWHAQRVHFYN